MFEEPGFGMPDLNSSDSRNLEITWINYTFDI